MKQKKLAIHLAIAGLVIGGIGLANAASQNGNATAEVVTPITVTETQVLNFGQFAVGTAGGAVIMSDSGAISAGADIDLLGSSGAQQGTFTILGQANKAIAVSVLGAATLSDGSASPNTMGLTASATTPPSVLDASGVATLNVGGVLSVVGNQAPGTYSTANAGGSPYSVTVNYQ